MARPPRSSAGLARWIAAGLGCGYAPRAPGTVAAAAASVVGCGLLLLGPWALAIGLFAAIGVGFWAIERAAISGDPGWVVIDEVAGQWLALLAAFTPSVPSVLVGFVLFRFFDILKPGPVHRVERAPGALGIIADDLLAGAFAAIVLLLLRAAFPGFFASLTIPT